jgi:hypothetical protein
VQEIVADVVNTSYGVCHAQGSVMTRSGPFGYENKFAEFISLCVQAKGDGLDHVLIARPFVLGDTYEEIIESLSRLAEAGLALRVAGR